MKILLNLIVDCLISLRDCLGLTQRGERLSVIAGAWMGLLAKGT